VSDRLIGLEELTLARAFVAIGGLIVLVLFAALLGPLFVDWTNYRDDFEREASRIIGQPVDVRGTADARLLPFPSVTFNDVVVGAPGEAEGDGEPQARIARFSMDVELAPFLSGVIQIFDMRIEEPVIRVELGEGGALDWAMRQDADLAASGIVLENVAISDAEIVVDDRQNGRVHRIEDMDAVLSAEALTGPWRMQGTAGINGERGAFLFTTGELQPDRTIRLRSRFLPDRHPLSLELEGALSVIDLKPSYAGTFTVQALDLAESASSGTAAAATRTVALRGTGLFEANNERLRISEYRLEVGAPEDPYVLTGEATLDTGSDPEFLLIAEGQQIDVDRLETLAEAPPAAEPSETEPEAIAPLSLAARLETVRRVAEAIPIPDLPGRVSLRLPAIIAGETTLRDVSLDARPDGEDWLIDQFAAALPGRTQMELSGALGLGEQFGFTGDLLLASNQPSGFAAWLTADVDPAIRALPTAGFSADVALSAGLQRFENLEMAVGPATLTGRFERRVADGRRQLSIDMAGDEIDIDAVRALVELFSETGSGDQIARHEIDARLSADRLVVGGVGLQGFETALTLQNGLLDMQRLSVADVAGARVTGQGTVAALPDVPSGAAAFTIEAADTGPLFELADRLTGPVIDLAPLVARSSDFADTGLRLEVQLGSARESEDAGDEGFDLTVTGTSGGSDVSVELASDAAIDAIWTAPIEAQLSLTNPEATSLLAQLGLPVLPIATGEAAGFDARFDGRFGEPSELALSFGARDTRLSLDGSATLSGSGIEEGTLEFAASSADFEPWLLMNGVTLPGFGAGLPIELSASLEVEPEAIAIASLSGRLDDNDIGGELTISRAAVPDITGRLSSDRIDLEWLAEAVFGRDLTASDGVGWAAAEFPADAASAFSADIALTANDAFLGFREAARGFGAQVRFGQGELRVTDVEAEWLGGDLRGNLTLGNLAGTGVAALQMQLQGADLPRVLAAPASAAPATGELDLVASLEMSGKSAEALIRSATGSGVLEARGLSIAALDEDAFPEILQAADVEGFAIAADTVADAARQALGDGRFTADQVTTPFSVAGGIARFANVLAENADASLTGDGSFDLAEAVLDARFRLAFDAGDETLTGATPGLLFDLGGSFRRGEDGGVAVMTDATELTNYLSLRAFERERKRVETVQAAVLEKQRLRREISFIRAQIREREAERLAAEAAAYEVERLAREAERAAAEARRRQNEARAIAEEQARREEALRAEERREAEEAIGLDQTPNPDPTTAPLGRPDIPVPTVPVPDGQAVQRGGVLPPPADSAPPLPSPLEQPASPDTLPANPPTLDFGTLPGVETFQ
jgi:uncharacterized protein involved in outer membrane biogenesis